MFVGEIVYFLKHERKKMHIVRQCDRHTTGFLFIYLSIYLPVKTSWLIWAKSGSAA